MINWGEAWKQIWDWGGDYDVLPNASFDGGVRDAKPRSNKLSADWNNTQGENKPGYDSTGRKITSGGGGGGISSTGQKKASTPQRTSSPDPQVVAYNAAAAAAAAKEAQDKANAIAAYDEQIRQNQSALNRLGGQQRIGESNILDSYNAARRDNQSNFNQSTGMYNMRTNDAIDAFGRRRDEIEGNAADQTRSARGIFAAGGAGDSSFASVLAPFKIAEAASRVQGDEHDTYARNRRDMDINYTAVKNAYNQNKKKFDVDQANDLNALRQKIRTSRADLQDTIRNLNAQKAVASGSSLASALEGQRGAADRINKLRAEVDELGRKRTVTGKSVEWKAPDLASYGSDEVTVRPGDADDGLSDQIAPNLRPILGEEDEKKKQLGWV